MQLTLTDRESIAEGTAAFWFEPEERLNFIAGQFGDFTLLEPDRTDANGNTRTFSIASAPTDNRLMIATRMRDSAFKQSLWQAEIGTKVQFTGPMGAFTLHKDAAIPAVFLAGGIGITPVRSIAEYATLVETGHSLTVFHSNRTRELSAFHDEFVHWAGLNARLNFVPTLTDAPPAEWRGETGFIREEMIRKYVPDPASAIFYVVGPPAFVIAMEELLARSGVGKPQIVMEGFIGY